MFFAYIDPGTGYTVFSLGAWLIAFLLGFFGIFSLFLKKILRFLKSHKKAVTIICLLAILALIFIMGGVKMLQGESRFDRKVVILGFDGLDPKIIEEMMAKGELPNFSSLKEKGSYRRLKTTNPSQSPVAWTGFATGKNPGKSGVFDFIMRDPKTYTLSLSLSNVEKGKAKRVIKGKCFWQYTSSKKVPTVIIGCPVTFPPDKIYGKMLSGMGVPDILGTEGTFTFYTTKPLGETKDIGGNVFRVRKSSVMIMNLIGPKVAGLMGKAENTKVPFKVSFLSDPKKVSINFQGKSFQLKVGQWSDWQEVSFKLGLFKGAKGIFKMYLVETEPEFKLYISPINFDPKVPFFQISFPKNYSKELAKEIGFYYTQGMPMDTWAVNEKRLGEEPFIEVAKEVLREKKAMLDYELKHLKKGVLFCYFESPDIIQHMFWRYTDKNHPLYQEDAPQEYKEMIRSWYKKMDSILGETMKELDEKDTIIVLSDHGFNTFRRAAHLNSWLREKGYLKLKNPYAESGVELLGDIDWSKTKAYSIGFGAIYINQKGREAEGIIAPGRESELLKEEISKRLKEWQDEKYRSSVINNVYSKEDLFWGDYTKNAPDLYVGFNIGYRASWQTALGAVPNNLIEDNLKKWSGSHLFDPVLIPAIIFSNLEIKQEQPSIYDIAPTVLKIVGFSNNDIKSFDFDGEPLFD